MKISDTLLPHLAFRAFHVFCVRQDKDRTIVDDDFEESEEDGELECSGCRREKDSCACPSLLSQG